MPSSVGLFTFYDLWWKKTEAELGWRTDFLTEYELTSHLGKGSFGEVRIAVHKQSGQEVAVKTMPKVRRRFTRAKTLDKIRRESQMMRNLQSCPSVVRLIDTFEDADDVHMVLELCRGGDLRRFVEANGCMDEKCIACVALQVLEFIQSCHDQEIFYGDLKPANFVLVDSGSSNLSSISPRSVRVKAIDFGNSQVCGESHRLTKWRGTLTFLSPEVYSRNYGQKAEIWSLGVMLYWLFCRRYPFWTTTDPPAVANLEDMARVVTTAPIVYNFGPWKTMSPEGLDFVSKCLERDEGLRMSVSDALQHPWFYLAQSSHRI